MVDNRFEVVDEHFNLKKSIETQRWHWSPAAHLTCHLQNEPKLLKEKMMTKDRWAGIKKVRRFEPCS